MQPRPLRIGLTGGIGSGKSTVASLLAGHGAAVIDTDAIAHRLVQPGGAALAALRAAFGNGIFDASGGLDRARMRTLVFHDADAKQRLEAVLHPLIRTETAREAAAHAGAPVLVFDVPLLVESGRWREQVDRVLVVDCSEATQVQRVVQRSGWTAETVGAAIAMQASRAARRACADAVVHNDGISLETLSAQIDALWTLWAARPA